MSTEPDKLELDRNPTPTAESQTFSNSDERRDNYAHELKLLNLKQGHIGRLIGCSDTSVTVAFVVIILALICAIGCVIGMPAYPTLNDPLKLFIGIVLTFGGYLFGRNSKAE